MTQTYYIDPHGVEHLALPRTYENSSPVTERWALAHGWTKHERELPATVQDYDDALEDYCLEVREARGWTTTDPRMSIGSKVPRWNQDGMDYRDFREDVLLYGLDVENRHAAGEAVPTLDEFKAHLRTIECRWTYEVEQ